MATLCENGGTSDVMVKSKDTFVPLVVPHPISRANHMEVSKVEPKSWHAIVVKFHDLLEHATIDQINVTPRVVVVHDEEGMCQLRGALTR